jgi:hypothetical protein
MAVAKLPTNVAKNGFGQTMLGMPMTSPWGRTTSKPGGFADNEATSSTQANSTTNSTTTGESTQRDTGSITTTPLVEDWAKQGLQDQFNQTTQDLGGSRSFYESILGGENAQADMWANRLMKQLLQEAQSAPGFTDAGSASRGMAAGEALAGANSQMFDKMFQASEGLAGLTQRTTPFLGMARDYAPVQEVRDLTSTRNFNETMNGSSSSNSTTNSSSGGGGGGGVRSGSSMQGAPPAYSGFVGTMGNNKKLTPGKDYKAWAQLNGMPVIGR